MGDHPPEMVIDGESGWGPTQDLQISSDHQKNSSPISGISNQMSMSDISLLRRAYIQGVGRYLVGGEPLLQL